MRNLDVLVNGIGIAYGLLLISAAFVRVPFLELMRIDTLVMRDANESTRPVNLLAGLLIAGYAFYALAVR